MTNQVESSSSYVEKGKFHNIDQEMGKEINKGDLLFTELFM